MILFDLTFDREEDIEDKVWSCIEGQDYQHGGYRKSLRRLDGRVVKDIAFEVVWACIEKRGRYRSWQSFATRGSRKAWEGTTSQEWKDVLENDTRVGDGMQEGMTSGRGGDKSVNQ